MVAVEVVVLLPSPKFQAYVAMDPKGAPEAEPLNDVADPGDAGATVNDAVGAWSGVTAM